MTRPVPVGVVVLVIAVVFAGICSPIVLIGAGQTGFSDTQSSQSGGQTTPTADVGAANDVESQDFDSTTYEITVHENGSATWTFRYEQQLKDDEAKANFEAFAKEFENNETGLYNRFTEQAKALTENGANTTDREMAATNFNRSASVEYRPGAMGVVEMSFVWEGFATVENGKVIVGDVFQNMYLASDQSIVVKSGDGLVFTSVAPEGEHTKNSVQEANSITWSGEREFLNGRPRVVLQSADNPAGSGTKHAVSPIGGIEAPSWALGIGLIAIILGGGIAIKRYRGDYSDNVGSDALTDTPAAAGDNEPEPATETDPHSADDSHTETEFLTDEDRVVKLIRSNGGRMKQVNIVDETNWSKSKVSMLLSDMEDEGTISKLRVGRENIISLEGFEPEATKSPFDE